MFMLSITLRICYDPTFLFDKYSEYMSQKHSQELLNRIDDDKKDVYKRQMKRTNRLNKKRNPIGFLLF